MNEFIGEARKKRLKFREILARPKLTVMPGGFSPLYARMAETIGFECFFVAGSQTSAFLYGVPDTGIVGLRDIADHVRHVAARTNIPILVDCDTGFGNAVNVAYTVAEMIRTGVAALQIEDQEAPKKSGTSAGRRCIPMDEAVGKIAAATAARDEIDPSFVICARCDLIGAEGGTFEEALERSVAYVEKGRADFIWLNTVETREQIAQACKAIPAPVMPLWGGPLPAPTPLEFEQLGAKIALYPTVAATVGMNAAWMVLNDFYERGPEAMYEYAARIRATKWGAADQHKLVGLEHVREIEERFLPERNRRDYDGTWGHASVLAPEERAP
ncbi:MAG TPA: isocitrate lyase/PEP mutase family protein [Candidatus Binatia bacterium]|nr:isocitrate lyase/PEP mutase family protein [Candidatus Binatia bacterium]